MLSLVVKNCALVTLVERYYISIDDKKEESYFTIEAS